MCIGIPFVLSKFEETLNALHREELHPREELYVSYRKLFYAGFMAGLFYDPLKETFVIKIIEDEAKAVVRESKIDIDGITYSQYKKFISQSFCPIKIEGSKQVEDFYIMYLNGICSALTCIVKRENIDQEVVQGARFECYLFLGSFCK